MEFREAVSRRVIDLCNKYHYSPNALAELSGIPPTTLQDLVNKKAKNPSSLVIYKLCVTLKISLKDFFDDELFDFKNIED